MRKQNRVTILKSYLNATKDDSDKLSGPVMFRILNQITTSDDVVISALDYVTALLVNDTCELLQNMVNLCVERKYQSELCSLILSSKNFLKHKYANHVSISDDNVCYHSLQYGLEKAQAQRKSHSCEAHKFPFYVTECIKKAVHNSLSQDQDMMTDAANVIDDVSDKLKLYMGHVCRKRNQNKYILLKQEYIKKVCEDSKGDNIIGILIMDFKMKFEAMSSREYSIEHYGKRGTGWHGLALCFYQWQKCDD